MWRNALFLFLYGIFLTGKDHKKRELRLKYCVLSTVLYRSVVQSCAWKLQPSRECTSSLCVEFSTETSQSGTSLANCKSNYLCTSQNLLSLAKGR